MKAQWDVGGGRISLGDNTGGGAVLLRPIRFCCVGIWISTGLPLVYTSSWPYVTQIRLTADLAERNYCIKSGSVCWIGYYCIYAVYSLHFVLKLFFLRITATGYVWSILVLCFLQTYVVLSFCFHVINVKILRSWYYWKHYIGTD
jgi:hypothetical protein